MQFKNEINPKLWDKDELRPEVKAKLRQIANNFIEFLDINKEAVVDVVITGSCASYNYTKDSDIDLHLIIDFDKVHKDCPIVGEYLLSKKSEFNNNHDIYIYEIPVEVYAESVDNDNIHNGLYSVKDGKWLEFPKKLKPTDNDGAVRAKYKEFEAAIKEVKDGEMAERLLDRIKRMRKSGLAEGGEFSTENLVFKKLRNNGLIGDLMKIKKDDIDKALSLEEAIVVLEGLLEDMSGGFNTGVSAFGPLPNNLAGQGNPFTKEGKLKSKGLDKRSKRIIRVNGTKKKEKDED